MPSHGSTNHLDFFQWSMCYVYAPVHLTPIIYSTKIHGISVLQRSCRFYVCASISSFEGIISVNYIEFQQISPSPATFRVWITKPPPSWGILCRTVNQFEIYNAGRDVSRWQNRELACENHWGSTPESSVEGMMAYGIWNVKKCECILHVFLSSIAFLLFLVWLPNLNDQGCSGLEVSIHPNCCTIPAMLHPKPWNITMIIHRPVGQTSGSSSWSYGVFIITACESPEPSHEHWCPHWALYTTCSRPGKGHIYQPRYTLI